jgi:hypothetical protein
LLNPFLLHDPPEVRPRLVHLAPVRMSKSMLVDLLLHYDNFFPGVHDPRGCSLAKIPLEAFAGKEAEGQFASLVCRCDGHAWIRKYHQVVCEDWLRLYVWIGQCNRCGMIFWH